MILGVIFTSCLLISNIVSSKLVQLGPWSITAAVIIFPLSYIIGDIMTEVYGFKAARRVMWLGFAMNFMMVVLFTIVVMAPAPGWYEHSEAYATVLGNTPRLFIASMAAYIVGYWVNAVILSKLKVKTGGKHFGFRAIISTFFGELADSLIFVPIGFLGQMPFEELVKMLILQVTFKTAYEIVILPITSKVVKKIKEIDGIDVTDYDEEYKLFG